MNRDRNCLSTWFPKLVQANLPVPRTEIIDAGEDWHKMLGIMDDPVRHKAVFDAADSMINDLSAKIKAAVEKNQLKYPIFLRTGQGSGKHNWKNCCFVQDASNIPMHITALIEWSEMVDFMGLPWRYWCVREMLPVTHIATLPRYGDMPLVVEHRAFISDGKVVCLHPYWPEGSILEGLQCDHSRINTVEEESDSCKACADTAASLFAQTRNPQDEKNALKLAELAAIAFADDGSWSVDILKTESGLFITDMASAEASFHYEGCKKAKRFKRKDV